MIVKVKSTIETSREITFPSYWKINEAYCKPKYLAFFSEKSGLFITEGFTWETTPEAHDWNIIVSSTKEEVEAIFIENQKRHKAIMFHELPTYPIMDDNNDISILEGESLKKESDGN